jgi:hypothetical protein
MNRQRWRQEVARWAKMAQRRKVPKQKKFSNWEPILWPMTPVPVRELRPGERA